MANTHLEGIRVVELGTYIAVPACGRMLADMGASVIKIESLSGDTYRIHGANNGIKADEGENPLFDIYNSGKECIALNLKSPAGKGVMDRLLRNADIFITNTRRKSLEKLGLDWETLHEKYPQLICGTLSGFGDKGPEAEAPGFDSVAFWAKTGFLADMTVRAEGSYPVQHPTGVGDAATASLLLSGLLAALYDRTKTGVGQCVSTSLYSAGLWFMGCMVVMAQEKYGLTFPKAQGEGGAFRAQFRGSDGEWLMVMIIDEGKYAESYFEVLDRQDLLQDERFSTIAARRLHKKELFDIVAPIFATKTSGEWLEKLRQKDIPCTRVNHFADVAHSEQAWVNDYIETEHFPNGTTGIIPCPPIRFGEETVHTYPADRLGESTEKVLRSLNYSEEEISWLLENGTAIQHR